MPPAVVAALIGAGVAGTEMGLQASGTLTPSTSGSTNAATAAAQAQQKQQEAQNMRAVAGNAQEQTGGSLADPAMAQLIATLAGNPGDIGLAQQTIFGGGGGGSSPGTTVFSGQGTPGLASSTIAA